MKMAKLQKATLDPTKISGRCGRLKCCLRYEYDTYEHCRRICRQSAAEVVTAKGRVRVLAHEILASQLLVETEESHAHHDQRRRRPERLERRFPPELIARFPPMVRPREKFFSHVRCRPNTC